MSLGHIGTWEARKSPNCYNLVAKEGTRNRVLFKKKHVKVLENGTHSTHFSKSVITTWPKEQTVTP